MKLINELKTHSFLQQIHWIADPVNYLENAVKFYPNIFTGKIVGFGGFGSTLVFVQEPKALQQIFANDKKQFSAPTNDVLQPILGVHSVGTVEGKRHDRKRKLLMPPFHGARLHAYGELISNLSNKIFHQLPIGQPFFAAEVMQEITLQVILKVVFGLNEGERYQQMKQLSAELLGLFNSPLTAAFLFFPWLQRDLGNWSLWGKFVRIKRQIDILLYAEIRERREQVDSERNDILSLLLSSRDEEGNPMTEDELRDELMTLMLGGNETTATALSWAFYWVHHLPEVQEKLLQELATLNGSLDPITIFRLPYLTAVCNETLRIYPVSLLTLQRSVEEPVELLEHKLEPGTDVVGCIYLLHQREDLYPQPNQFRPERFLERQYTPFEFMPFGNGTRRCIGEALALYEMKIVLATILSSYQLALVDTKPEEVARRGLTLAPANGVKMMIQGKRTQQLQLVEGFVS
ncbi:cytochrome P450 [Nostoc sp.]|uniref:cytochrome P450 n=1 Tax=Nostoc sp. TaxID=1180 RepID=UPI002FF0E706